MDGKGTILINLRKLTGHGLVSIDGVVHSCPLVKASELKKRRSQAVADSHGSNIFIGEPPLSLHASLKDSKEVDSDDWHFDGSRGVCEWINGAADGPVSFTSCHAAWLRMSDVAEGCSQAHAHRQICECLRLALLQDSLRVDNLSCFERMVAQDIPVGNGR